MTFSGCDTSPTVDCCSFSICRTQSPEELGRVGERSLGWSDCRAATLTFFFNAYAEKERTRREGRQNFPLASQKLHPLRCMQKRDSVSVPRSAELRAGRLSGRFRLRAYRTVQTRWVSSQSVHHGIFPYVYFYTHSLQRPHERRPMSSRREQVSALFFVACEHTVVSQNVFHGLQKGQIFQGNTNFQKSFFFLANNFVITTRGPKGERGVIATRTTFLLIAPLFFTFLTSNFPTLFVLLNFILWSGSFVKIPSGKWKISETPPKTP